MHIRSVCFDDIEDRSWDSLLANKSSSVFQTKGWLQSWWQHNATPERVLKLYQVSNSAGEAVAVLPFFHQPRKDDLLLLGYEDSDYQDILVRADQEPLQVLGSGPVQHELRKYSCIRVLEYREDSHVAQWLAQGAQNSVELERTPCPGLFLSLDKAEDFQSHASFKRKHRKMMALGNVKIEHTSDRSRIQSLLPLLFTMHISRWSGTNSPSLFQKESNRAFYQSIAGKADIKCLFTVVWLEEKPLACHLGFYSGADFIWYKPAFDPAFARYSPGMIMLTELIRFTSQRGCSYFDFTRGDESFKSRYADSVRYNRSSEVYRSRVRARIRKFSRGARQAARRAIARK